MGRLGRTEITGITREEWDDWHDEDKWHDRDD